MSGTRSSPHSWDSEARGDERLLLAAGVCFPFSLNNLCTFNINVLYPPNKKNGFRRFAVKGQWRYLYILKSSILNNLHGSASLTLTIRTVLTFSHSHKSLINCPGEVDESELYPPHQVATRVSLAA